MSNWNLRRVHSERGIKVYEVYYDEQGRPWTYADANFLDKLRLIRDWLWTPVLTFPTDFTGEPAWMKELGELVKL